MNIDSFLDEYKFISDFYKVVYSPEYVSLSKDEKKEVLIRLIEINTQRKNSDIIKRLEGNLELSISSKYEEKEVLKDIARPKRVKQRKFEDVNINPILECSSIEQMLSLGLIPKKEDEESLKKIQKILLTIVREIEEYKLLQVEEESDFFDEEIEKLENIFEIISDYAFYEENVEIETQSDFSVVYLPNNLCFGDDNNFSPLYKDIEKNKKQEVLVSMIDSIKNQEFKGLKRFGNHFSDFYELRNGQQRVVFNFITPKIAVVIFAFTKKVDNDKKYRMELSNRIKKYRGMKSQLKKVFKDEKFISKQIDIDTAIYGLIHKEKSLVKVGEDNE
ncbi:MAG: hypothetical protein IK997_07280 [Bacilli bacterium]|nr:hypothetical protein [Bacilli bacterium]